MTKGLRLLTLLAAALVFVLHAASANAQATRTWVSGVGDDANPCSRTAPCKTFPGAISKTAAGGEINCIDPGGFGAVTITKAITIDCANTEAGVLVSGTNAITVSAGAGDVVVLRGLDIIGTAATPALNGIVFNTGAALHVEQCVIREFLSGSTNGFGILFRPTGTSQLFVSNTTIINNGSGSAGGAIMIKPSGSANIHATISDVKAQNNITGITADGTATTGSTNVDVVNTVSAGAAFTGISVVTPASGGGSTLMLVDRSSIVNNATGINSAGAKSAVLLGNSSVSGNGTGLTFSGSGQLLSYKTNNINGNSPDGSPSGPVTQN